VALTNHERVGRALELLRVGLTPFVERAFRAIRTSHLVVDLGAGADGPGVPR
jgi:hypothetical protein